jgi:transcriptional regulator GlxA family with amidase domain
MTAQASHTKSIHELQVWMMENLDRPLSVDLLADRVAMSARNFARVFTQELGTTPSRYLCQLRVEAARRLLEQTDKGLKQVATASGFGSVDVMRRAFARALGSTPQRYRDHFHLTPTGSRTRIAVPRWHSAEFRAERTRLRVKAR